MEPMNTTPIYRQSGSYAREHGELDQFCESRRANLACREAIEGAISRSFDGMRLKHDAPTAVLDQFGTGRVRLVLAATVQVKLWDGRFSQNNKDWSQTIMNAEQASESEFARWGEMAVSSHPAVLNGFINLARQEIQAREKSSVKEALHQPAVAQAKSKVQKESQER